MNTTIMMVCRHDHPGRDRGQITLAAIMFAFGMLVLLSLVAFQGTKLRAGRAAGNLAEEAARAGAGEVNQQTAYSHGTFAIDPTAAIRQARAYLAAAGVPGTVTVVGGRRVKVTVTVSEPTPLLSVIGVRLIRVTRIAVADLVTGVTGEGT